MVIEKRAVTKANMDKLRSEVQNINWEFLRTIKDVDDAYSDFKETFMCLYNKCIPEKNLSNKETKIHKKPWITKGFIKSSKIKNKLYKKILNNGNEELKAKYKYCRNRLNKLKNILKRRYYEHKFDTAKSDIKQTWKLVNEVINRKKILLALQNLKKIMSVLLTRGKLLIDSMNILLMSELTLQRKQLLTPTCHF